MVGSNDVSDRMAVLRPLCEGPSAPPLSPIRVAGIHLTTARLLRRIISTRSSLSSPDQIGELPRRPRPPASSRRTRTISTIADTMLSRDSSGFQDSPAPIVVFSVIAETPVLGGVCRELTLQNEYLRLTAHASSWTARVVKL